MTKPGIKIIESKDKIRLVASGNLTVQHSKELQQLLLQHCDFNKSAQLLLDEVNALDIAGIQLAYAWKSAVTKNGSDAQITFPTETALSQLLEKASITKIF